jgi:hypothetical protein
MAVVVVERMTPMDLMVVQVVEQVVVVHLELVELQHRANTLVVTMLILLAHTLPVAAVELVQQVAMVEAPTVALEALALHLQLLVHL